MRFDLFKKKITLIVCFLVVNINAQENVMTLDLHGGFFKAIQLYNAKVYTGAKKTFELVSKTVDQNSNMKLQADYYIAMCSLKLNGTNGEKAVIAFVKEHPFSAHHNKAYYNLGNYYFSNRKASNSLKWFSKVDLSKLSADERNETNFKMGYMMLINKYYSDAKEKFSTLLGSPDYGNDSRYYYGYISYREKNFEEANENFSQLANDASYNSTSNYYLLDMAFKNGDFDKAVTIGKKVLEKPEKGQKSDIVKIIGESYFNLKKYEEAIPYLIQYKSENGKWNNTNLYYIGYCYYKKKDYESALKYFTKIIDGNNTIAQNAYYHLGICYMELEKKTQALNAFKNAYDMNFDPKVQEDAALQYAKLSYEQGNPYKTVPETLKEYITKYPNSKNVQVIKDLLIVSYLYEQDFENALLYLKSIEADQNSELYKEVSLYRGIQLFHNRKFRKAIDHFTLASNSKDISISNKAKYWKAESFYNIGKYNESLTDLLGVDKKSSIDELLNIDYNIGYSYFKQNNYLGATPYFANFIKQQGVDAEMRDDAINRLGDSFYAIKAYGKAVNNYNTIIEAGGVGADYALYQRAMCKGLLGNKNAELKDLEKLRSSYENSVYIDDALYQIAGIYTFKKQSEKAQEYYNLLISNYPNSSYIPAVLLRKGLYEYGKNDYDKALVTFKGLVARFPNAEESKQAITNVRNVCIDKGSIDPYVEWVKTLSNVNISKREIDDSSFTAAENRFFNDEFDVAIKSFGSYIKKFPDGAHLLKANYYLAESYYNSDQKDKAIPYYNFITKQEKNEFTEDANAKLSQVYLDLAKWSDAIPFLELLEHEANLEHNIIFAKSNLMKAYYEKKNYKKAKEYADKVLGISGLDQTVIEDAKLILARIAIINEDYVTARDYYEVLDHTAIGVVKAECLYYKALFLHEDKEYKSSNDQVQVLIEGYSNHKYWGVKSYIVMAKNYFALGDSYQAVYILESVLKNFSEYTDLTQEANNELRRVKSEEAKENESVSSKMTKK